MRALFLLLLCGWPVAGQYDRANVGHQGLYPNPPGPPNQMGAMPPSGYNYNLVPDGTPWSDVTPYGAFHPKEILYNPQIANNFQAVSTSPDSIDPNNFVTYGHPVLPGFANQFQAPTAHAENNGHPGGAGGLMRFKRLRHGTTTTRKAPEKPSGGGGGSGGGGKKDEAINGKRDFLTGEQRDLFEKNVLQEEKVMAENLRRERLVQNHHKKREAEVLKESAEMDVATLKANGLATGAKAGPSKRRRR